MNVIDVFNSTVSDAINKNGDTYKAVIGNKDFIPDPVIVESSDFNCGALSNELEFARVVSQYYYQSLDPNEASGDELTELLNAFINIPRIGSTESDESFYTRFKFIVNQNNNMARTTKWAIRDALSYYLQAPITFDIVEPFSATSLYFEIRIHGYSTTVEILTLDNVETGFLDQNFLGGTAIGAVITFINTLIQRIKAAGVNFEILFVDQNTLTLTSASKIGSRQLKVVSSGWILRHNTVTLTSSAQVS